MLRLTRAQVRNVDRISIEDYHLPGIILMENAALAVVNAAVDMLDGIPLGEILILCGGGNNGGDGLAVARHLHNRDATVIVALTVDPATYVGDALINWQVVRSMNLPVITATPAAIARSTALLIIDAVFGTGLTAAPHDPFPALAAAVNGSGRLVLAIDLPSGLDCDTGRPFGRANDVIRATRTVTFVAEKVGFASPIAEPYLGIVDVADIGCPREAIDRAINS